MRRAVEVKGKGRINVLVHNNEKVNSLENVFEEAPGGVSPSLGAPTSRWHVDLCEDFEWKDHCPGSWQLEDDGGTLCDYNIKKKSTLELQEIPGTKRSKRLTKGGRVNKYLPKLVNLDGGVSPSLGAPTSRWHANLCEDFKWKDHCPGSWQLKDDGRTLCDYNIKKKSTLELQEIPCTKRSKRLMKGGRVKKDLPKLVNLDRGVSPSFGAPTSRWHADLYEGFDWKDHCPGSWQLEDDGRTLCDYNIKKKSTLELQVIPGTKRSKRLTKGGRVKKYLPKLVNLDGEMNEGKTRSQLQFHKLKQSMRMLAESEKIQHEKLYRCIIRGAHKYTTTLVEENKVVVRRMSTWIICGEQWR
ncbi:hypothetical protein NC651_011473 [Populus alba x Populus x berolinensis]|nr:hypothetical protein NC651_011473 [Populus alba x Populus x berolinensis]